MAANTNIPKCVLQTSLCWSVGTGKVFLFFSPTVLHYFFELVNKLQENAILVKDLLLQFWVN